MIYILAGVTVIYALLSMLAAVVGVRMAASDAKRKDTHIIMLCGGAFLLAASVTLLLKLQYDFVLAVIGGALICAAAIVNGRRGERFHLSHHIVRFVLTVILTVGFMLL